MKILFIRQYNPFFENGASANRFAGLLKGLINRGVEIDILVTGGYWTKEEFVSHGNPNHNKLLKVQYSTTLFNNNIWFRRFNSFVFSKIILMINQSRIRSAIKGEYDYIWLTKDSTILSAFLAFRSTISGKTLIELNEFNDIYKGAGAIGNSLQLKQAEKENNVFTEAIKSIDCFAIMTKTLLKHYSSMSQSGAKMLHLPMTVDISRFLEKGESSKYKKPYIAFTGTFNNTKDGVDILIKAFSKIAIKYRDLHLYLAGFWHYDVPAQKKFINENNLSERITYLNVLNKAEIPTFLCNADLLVLSRPDSHQARGGFPTKLGEYLATGKPVCVTKVGEIPDYLTDNESAYLAEPGDIDSFADAMDRALSNEEKAMCIGLNGRKVAEREFNSEIQAQKLYDFLKENS